MALETKEKPTLVLELFNKIAPVYDLLNNIMSMGLHKRWKSIAVDMLEINPGDKVLDLCCGSGDIADLIAAKSSIRIEVKAVDFSENMLEIARKRLNHLAQVEVLHADAMNLPYEDDTFDSVIISFGLRNLKDITDALKEMNRVLNSSGKLVVIDFGKPDNFCVKALFDLYFDIFVPLLGKMFRNYSAYAYLPDSIKEYPSSEALISIMKEVGFSNAFNKNLFMGFVSIQKAVK